MSPYTIGREHITIGVRMSHERAPTSADAKCGPYAPHPVHFWWNTFWRLQSSFLPTSNADHVQRSQVMSYLFLDKVVSHIWINKLHYEPIKAVRDDTG